LADLYGQTDQWARGVERLEQAIRAGADDPGVHCLIGRLCQAGGQLDRARQAYKRALDLNENYSAAKEALEALPV
jgi:predicted Zn-dependent protease